MRILLAALIASLSFAQSTPPVNVAMSSLTSPAIPMTCRYTVSNSGVNLAVFDACAGTTTNIAKAAATTQSVTLFTIPAKGQILSCTSKTVTAFVGPTTLTSTVGVTGSLTGCDATVFNLKTAVGNTQLSVALPATPVLSYAGVAVVLALTTTIDNVTTISAGSVDVIITWQVLPLQ